MCSVTELNALEREHIDTLRYRLASKHADSLVLEFGISAEERNFASALADPRCGNNRDALRVWIMEQLEEQDEFSSGKELPFLRQRLTQRLQDFESELQTPQKVHVHQPISRLTIKYPRVALAKHMPAYASSASVNSATKNSFKETAHV